MIPSAVLFALRAFASTPDDASMASRPTAFILYCQCDTRAERERIAAAARRKGGRILYIYDQLKGLAVAAPAGRNPAKFERSLGRIPGVVAVHPDGVMHTTGQGPAATLAR